MRLIYTVSFPDPRYVHIGLGMRLTYLVLIPDPWYMRVLYQGFGMSTLIYYTLYNALTKTKTLPKVLRSFSSDNPVSTES